MNENHFWTGFNILLVVAILGVACITKSCVHANLQIRAESDEQSHKLEMKAVEKGCVVFR